MSGQARQQRRAYERWLKKTDPIKYKEWKSESISRGNKIYLENLEKARQYESEQYEELQKKIIQSLRDSGKSDAEIDLHIEKWVKNIKIWGSKESKEKIVDNKEEY